MDMEINVLLGKSKSGRSKYIFDEIDGHIKANESVVLFVPSQSRMIEEENYMNYQKKDGIIGVNITTISAYVSDMMKSFNINIKDKYITDLERKLIISKIISKNSDIFKIFGKTKTKEGFAEMLYIYIDLFKKENIDITKLDELDLADKILEFKLKEIGQVYKKYIDETKDKYIDNVDEIDLVSQKIVENSKQDNNKKQYFYFDGYNNFTKHEYSFIESLLKCNSDITISLTANTMDMQDFENEGIFSVANATLLELIKLSKRTGATLNIEKFENSYLSSSEDIRYLAQNIFQNTNIKKVEAKNVKLKLTTNQYTEISQIAEDICKKVRNGDRYNEFAIYTSDIEEYQHVLKQIFYEYNIPIYLDNSEDISSNSLYRYISKLLETVCFGLRNENLFEILKIGLNDMSIEDVNYFENYVLEFNISKYGFNKEFSINNTKRDEIVYDIQRINKIRIQILKMFEDIMGVQNLKLNIKEIVEKIYLHLVEKQVLKNFEEETKKLEDSNDPYLMYLGNINVQVWSKICEVFDSISKIYEDEKIKIEEFKNIFEYSKNYCNLKSIPPTIDQVELLDVNLSKTGAKKHVYFIGVNENKLPKKVDEDVLFSDMELVKLENQGIEFKKSSISKLNMELYNIYEAICNAKDSITFTIPVSEISGKSLRPSSIVTNIKQILDANVIGDIAGSDSTENMFDTYSEDLVFDSMTQEMSKVYKAVQNVGKYDKEARLKEVVSVYRYFEKNSKKYSDILRYIKDDSNLSQDNIQSIYGDSLKTSVSRLELFKKCPFSYYINYGLKLKPRKTYSISNMDIGSFMHAVLERFSIYLFENNIKWQEVLTEEKGNTLKVKLDEIINKELDYSLNKHKESVKFVVLRQKLINTMQKVIITIAKGFSQSEFEPYGYELEFREGKLFAPIQIKLNDKEDMYLVGKIDRIDTAKINDKIYARIVDYKSSNKTLSIDDIKEGVSLQLVTYLYAFIQSKKTIEDVEVIPSAMLYFNLSDKLINLSSYPVDSTKVQSQIIKNLRMNGIFLKDLEVIKKMDNKLETDERLIDISARTLNSNNSKKAIEKDEYIKLCEDVKGILKQIGNEVMSGVVKIKPLKKKDVCKYCNFASVCRKDICL